MNTTVTEEQIGEITMKEKSLSTLEYFKVLEIVGKYFENNISLKRSNAGKGTMTIHFSSDEEVRKFLKALEDSKF